MARLTGPLNAPTRMRKATDVSDHGPLRTLSPDLTERLADAAHQPPFRAEALSILKAVRAYDAFPLKGQECLGFANTCLALGEDADALTWAQAATDTLAHEGDYVGALLSQIVACRAQIRRQELSTAREMLRDVAAATDRLLGEPEGDEATESYHTLRGAFALAAAELRVEAHELDEAAPLYADALEDLTARSVAALRVLALQGLALVAIFAQQTESAVDALQKAAKLVNGRGALAESLEISLALAQQLLGAGEVTQAKRLAAACKARAQGAKNQAMEAAFNSVEAMAATFGKDGPGAVEAALDAMDAFAKAGDPWGYTQMLTLVANGQLQQELTQDAAMTLISGAAALRAQGLDLPAQLVSMQLEELRARMGHDAFEALTGQILTELESAEGS